MRSVCTRARRYIPEKLKLSSVLYSALVLLVLTRTAESRWQDNIRPKMYVQLEGSEEYQRFGGNETFSDHFQLLLRDGNNLLIGARNVIFNISLTTLTENQRLEWYAEPRDIEMCIVKGRTEDECQNYIRVLTKTGEDQLLVCGTQAYRPLCRGYTIQNGQYVSNKDKQQIGTGLCPYDPRHNITFTYIDGDLYVGTMADFSGNDPLIYRTPLRTEQSDLMSLNAPNFVSSFSYKDHVYFFFRETAVEFINCGKAVYSRVARVCKQDRGGPHRFKQRWTSFLKSRLNCSVAGEFPFYFNEIQAVTDLIDGQYGGRNEQLVYAIFTTPVNSISGSAVCAFKMQDIIDTFEGPFKEQSDLNANWLPVAPGKVPDPRPGQCVNDSRTLPEITLNFIKSHSLMDEAVKPFFGEPLVVRTSFNYRFTVIAVDPQVRTPDGKSYDVLFIGTDNGRVIKAVNAHSSDTTKYVEPVLVEDLEVFNPPRPIKNLHIMRDSRVVDTGKLIVVSDDEVLGIRLQRCYSAQIKSCSDCVALRDPYCAWDQKNGKCRTVGSPEWSAGSHFIQSVTTGSHQACPGKKKSSHHKDTNNPDSSSTSAQHSSTPEIQEGQVREELGEIVNIIKDAPPNNEGPEISPSDDGSSMYSVETLSIAVATGSIIALIVGFISGYCCGRKCRKDEDDNIPYPDTEYEYFEQRPNLTRLNLDPKLISQEEVTYAEPILVPANKPINLALNHSPKDTLRKPLPPSAPPSAESTFQYPDDYAAPNAPRMPDSFSMRNRDNFGTLRAHMVQPDGYGTHRRDRNSEKAIGDGHNTTRSVKKVYL